MTTLKLNRPMNQWRRAHSGMSNDYITTASHNARRDQRGQWCRDAAAGLKGFYNTLVCRVPVSETGVVSFMVTVYKR